MKKIYSLLLLAGLCLFGVQSVKADDYYIRGSFNDWGADMMTYDDVNNVYYHQFDEVASPIEFKITLGNTNWDTQKNADNINNSLGDGVVILSGQNGGNITLPGQGGKYVRVYYSASNDSVWASIYTPPTPFVTLMANATNVLAGETITLTADAENFSGTVSYEYSYSTDEGVNYTPMAGNTMEAGASGTAYKFKVRATYNEEAAEATIDVNVIVCTVAGAFGSKGANADDEAFVTSWDPAQTANDMTYAEGVFTLKKSAVYLPAGTIYYKVVLNHNWDVNYPVDNQQLLIDEAGYYDLVFSFTWADREEAGNGVSATATLSPLVSLAADKAYALAGNTVTLTATPTNFTGDILYTYSYKVGEAEYVKIAENVASATYNWILPADVASGTYKIKVDAACAAQNQNATSTNTVEVKVANSWTVGGSLASVFDVAWADNATQNHMVATENDGVYTLTKSKVFIPASTTLEYKVFKDDANVVSYGKQSGGNQDYYFENAGYYDIVFTFNWGTEDVTASPSYICPKVEMKASFYSDWAEVEMETALNNESCSLTYPLLAGPYNASFMISVNDGAWVGYDNTITRTNCENWTLNDSEHPCSILADVDGDYTFTYDFSDGKIDVLYPNQIVRSAGNTNFQSLCVPFNATIENAKAYTFGSVNGSAVVLTEVVDNLVAGGAYIIQPESNDDVVITMVDGATLTAQSLGGAEGLYGVLGNSYTYIHDNDATWEVYVLQSDNKFHLISEGASATIKSTKAYLHLESAVGNAPSQLRIVLGENNTTGVENIEANEKAVKFFENGQLFILRDGVVYDATGRAVR